jgi:sugar O-acyltransferase (sialic acid O-acetyltransferase NeuD family)
MKEEILIFGCGGHSKVVIDIVEKQNVFKIKAIVDKSAEKDAVFFDYPLLEETIDLLNACPRGVIAIGDNYSRHKVFQKIMTLCPSFKFVTTIHPAAHIARDVTIGNGTVVVAGAIINSDSIVGDHCIINTNSALDHDCRMGDFSSLAPGVTVGGTVNIGNFSAITLGASIVHSLKIGEHTVIAAGSVVVSEIPSFSFGLGVPCKVVRKREAGERYL